MSFPNILVMVLAVVGCVIALAAHDLAEAIWAATAGIWVFIAGSRGA
jgi:hypothetical protein